VLLFAYSRPITDHNLIKNHCRTNRIMQPLEAAVFATMYPNLNLNPESIFPTRFQWCMCLPFCKKMKLDVIDVFKDSCETLFGRIILVILIINFAGGIGLLFRTGELSDLLECLIYALPALLFTLLGGIGLITIPLLFAFTLFYVRLELNHYYLIIPAVVAFFTLYKPLL
jgi:hypothetical protein